MCDLTGLSFSFLDTQVLKNKSLRDPERQSEIAALLGAADNDVFFELVSIGKRINDYVAEGEEGPGGPAPQAMDTLDEDVSAVLSLLPCTGWDVCPVNCNIMLQQTGFRV